MSKLTQDTAKEVIRYNRENVLYHYPRIYENTKYYLDDTSLRDFILKIYKFISKHTVIIFKHQYMFFADTDKLTYGIRKSTDRIGTYHKMQLLCALGFFRFIPQTRDNPDELIDANKEFFKNHPEKNMGMSTYAFYKYTEQRLKLIEGNAIRLKSCIRKSGSNISSACLTVNGLLDIANTVYPYNEKEITAERKVYKYRQLKGILEALIAYQGYAFKENLYANASEISNKEINNLLQTFEKDLQEHFFYKRPTAIQKQNFGLQSNKWIYTRKDFNGKKE